MSWIDTTIHSSAFGEPSLDRKSVTEAIGTDEGIINLEKHYYSVHKAFFVIVAFSLYTSVVVNYWLFGKDMISDMTVMPFIVGCAALFAAFTESRTYHKVIGIFMCVMFIFFQISDVNVIEFVL